MPNRVAGGFLPRLPHHPAALDPDRVGTYPVAAKSGGGYVWDAVLEYRVWCHPERGAPDEADGGDYFYAFADYEEAAAFAAATAGAERRSPWCCSASISTSPSRGITSTSGRSGRPSGPWRS